MEATERARKNGLLLLAVWLRIVSGVLGCALVALMWMGLAPDLGESPPYAPFVRALMAIDSPAVAALALAASGLLISQGLEMVAAQLAQRRAVTQAPSRALRWVGIALCWLSGLAALITLAFITVIKFGVLL